MATLRAQLKRAIDSKKFCPSCEDKDLYYLVAKDLKVRDDEIARLTRRLRDHSATPDGYVLLNLEDAAEMQRGMAVNAAHIERLFHENGQFRLLLEIYACIHIIYCWRFKFEKNGRVHVHR